MSAISDLPKAVSLKQLGEAYGIPESEQYKIPDLLPANCLFRIGRRWRVLVDPFTAWIQAGGSLKV